MIHSSTLFVPDRKLSCFFCTPLKLVPTCRPARSCFRGVVRAQKLGDKVNARLLITPTSGLLQAGTLQPCCVLNCEQVKEAEEQTKQKAEDVTEKYGLEAGLWNVFRSQPKDGKSKTEQAKDLLKRYGSAYLITSISLSLVSFSLCYALVSAGRSPAPLPTRNQL